jgi:hypothetical protein
MLFVLQEISGQRRFTPVNPQFGNVFHLLTAHILDIASHQAVALFAVEPFRNGRALLLHPLEKIGKFADCSKLAISKADGSQGGGSFRAGYDSASINAGGFLAAVLAFPDRFSGIIEGHIVESFGIAWRTLASALHLLDLLAEEVIFTFPVHPNLGIAEHSGRFRRAHIFFGEIILGSLLGFRDGLAFLFDIASVVLKLALAYCGEDYNLSFHI